MSELSAELGGSSAPAAPGRRAALIRVGGFTAACLLVSNMVGTGIFGTTGFMASDLGSPLWILLLWAAGAVYALMGALCYGELGAALPRSGGEYVYIREAYGPLGAFLSGWTSLTIGFSAAIASAAHLFANHVRELVLPALPQDAASTGLTGLLLDPKVLALAVVWALTAVHVTSVRAGGFVQRWLTIVKVGALVTLALLGLALGAGDWSHLTAPDLQRSFGPGTLLVTFMFVTFSYSGWNAVGYIAGELAEPAKNLPRAMIWGTLSVGALYLLLNLVYFYALPVSQLAADPIALVGHKTASALFGPGSGRWFTLLLTISILGAVSAMVWAWPQVYHVMARDGVFPYLFAASSERSGIPARSMVLQSLWISVLVLSGTFQALVLYATFVLILFAGIAVSSVIVLRHKRPDLPRPYRAWGYPVTPVLYLLLSLAILWSALRLRPTESLLGVATVAAGLPLYYVWKLQAQRKAARAAARTPG